MKKAMIKIGAHKYQKHFSTKYVICEIQQNLNRIVIYTYTNENHETLQTELHKKCVK